MSRCFISTDLCLLAYEIMCQFLPTNLGNDLKLKLKKIGGLSPKKWLGNLLKIAGCRKEMIMLQAFAALTLI